MAQAIDVPTTSRFHNLSNAALADALGHADAVLKGAEAEAKALKGADCLRPQATASPSGSRSRFPAGSMSRPSSNSSASWRRFEVPTVSTVVRIKAVKPLAAAA
jgi:hypothetical protein